MKDNDMPIPGKFYKTRGGQKIMYVGRLIDDYYLYQTLNGKDLRYLYPFYFCSAYDNNPLDIECVWEETEEISVKCYAVVDSEGRILYTSDTMKQGGWLVQKGQSVVELVGVLERRPHG